MMTVKRVSAVPSPDGRRVAFVVAEAVMEGEKSEWLSHVHVARRRLREPPADARREVGDLAGGRPTAAWLGLHQHRGAASPTSGASTSDGGEAEQVTDEKGGVTCLRLVTRRRSRSRSS